MGCADVHLIDLDGDDRVELLFVHDLRVDLLGLRGGRIEAIADPMEPTDLYLFDREGDGVREIFTLTIPAIRRASGSWPTPWTRSRIRASAGTSSTPSAR